MKPAVGFTLPSAGVTPAPNIRKKKTRDFVLVGSGKGRTRRFSFVLFLLASMRLHFFRYDKHCDVCAESSACLLSGWGRYPLSESDVYRPDKIASCRRL